MVHTAGGRNNLGGAISGDQHCLNGISAFGSDGNCFILQGTDCRSNDCIADVTREGSE